MTGFIIWTVLLVLVGLVWASRHLDVNRAKREQIPLRSDSYDGPPAHPPKVSFLIAAKDEEENIEPAVRSVLAQDYPDFELIVINDRSDDRTGPILDRLAAEDVTGRLKVVHVTSLREGWFGKNNAMREGMEHATGAWLCFGDADCTHTSPRTLSMAMRYALENGIDFLSVLPRLETRSTWERIMQPVCGALMVFWFHPRNVNNPKHAAAYANGAFMLMNRPCYDAIGGHDGVRTQVNEDMHLARLTKECGRRLFVMQNDDLYTVRMYSNFGAIWRGWSRIFYGCFGTFRKLLRTLMILLVMSIFPYASLVISGLLVLVSPGAAAEGWIWPLLGSGLAVAIQQSLLVRYYRLSYTNPWYAPTWIVGAVVGVGMLINAMLKLGGRRTTTWRGTTYRGHTLEPAAGGEASTKSRDAAA